MEVFMNLDIFTLLTILCIASFIQFIVLFIQYRVNKVYNGIGFWVLGYASMAAGYMLLFLRGIIPVQLVAIIAANSLILLGWIFLYLGVMRFIGKRENRGIIFTVFTVFILSFIYYTYFTDDIKLRTVIIYSAVAIISILTAQGLFTCKNDAVKASINFNFSLYIIQSCFYSYRPFDVLIFESFSSLFTPTMMQTVSFLFMFVEGILITFGLILMVNQRLNSEIKEDKENLELIFKTSPDAVLITRLSDGCFADVNDSFFSYTGYSRDEIIGRTALDLNLWADPGDRLNLVSILLEKNFCENMDVAFLRKDGTRLRGLLSARIIYLQGVPHIISVARDMSVRMEMEEALRESELKYRSLIENTSDVVFCVNEKGEYQFANNVFASTFGQAPDYFIGKTFWDIYPKEHADYRQEASRKVFETGEVQTIEVTVPLPDRTLYYLAKASPIKDETGKVILNLTTATDITERKTAEEALRKSEEKFRLLIENSHDIIYMLTSDGMFTFVSPSWTALLGHHADSVVGQSFQDFVHPDDIPACLVWLQKVIETGQRQEGIEYRVRHADGTWYWHTSSAVPMFDENGLVKGYEGTARDITDRKIAEETLKAKSDELERYFTSSLDLLCIADIEGRFIRLNPEWEKVLGYTITDIEGKSFLDFVHQEDMEKTLAAMSQLEAQNQVLSFENRYRHKDGSYRWIEWRSRPEGNTIYAAARDITKRKKAEQALRESEAKLSTLFSAMTEMVVLHEIVFDENGAAVNYIITDCNNAYTAITGIKRDDAVGKLATEVYRMDTAPYLEEFLSVALTGVPYEYTTYFEPMGKHFSVSVVSPKKNSFATITTDITGVRRVQEVISAKNKELENYLYIASHDLRSPLVNIQGFSRRLQKHVDLIKHELPKCSLTQEGGDKIEAVLDNDIPRTLSFIFSSVTKMDSLLNGLLHVSRTGRTVMTIKEIDVNQLLKTIIGLYNFQLTELDAVVTIEEVPSCYGDTNLLNQLFSNLIGNAIKYRDEGRQLVIEIKGRQEYVKSVYSIRDNGLGINKRHIEKIWDMFYRADLKQTDAGEGIGLSIVKRIAEKHNGKVWAESEPGKGSIFYVELQRNDFS
jgi:PAS domain S-box-containing protein